jgi:hypothetical protein
MAGFFKRVIRPFESSQKAAVLGDATLLMPASLTVPTNQPAPASLANALVVTIVVLSPIRLQGDRRQPRSHSQYELSKSQLDCHRNQ